MAEPQHADMVDLPIPRVLTAESFSAFHKAFCQWIEGLKARDEAAGLCICDNCWSNRQSPWANNSPKECMNSWSYRFWQERESGRKSETATHPRE